MPCVLYAGSKGGIKRRAHKAGGSFRVSRWPRLCAGLFALTGFLEHHGTRLLASEQEKHMRVPTIAAFWGSRASQRKSSLLEWVMKFLENPELPEGLRGCACMTNEGTARGHRNNFYNFNRSGLFTSEVSEVYKTSFTDPGTPTSKMASKPQLNKWLHGEKDKSCIGSGVDDHSEYMFFHWVVGQVQPVLEVLSVAKGHEVGFPKRFNLCFANSRVGTSRIDSTASQNLLDEFVDWMAKEVTPHCVRVACDRFADGWLQQIQQAVQDFSTTTEGLHAAWEQKLLYADSDILRWANVVRRMRQFLRAKSGVRCRGERLELEPLEVREVQYGINAWCRQLQLYGGLMRDSSRGVELLGPVTTADPEHLVLSWCLTETKATTQVQSTSVLRKKCKSKLRNVCGLSTKVRSEDAEGDGAKRAKAADGPSSSLVRAVDKLAEAGVVEIVPRSSNKGHQVRDFRKRKWDEVRGSESASAMCQRLRVGPEHFPFE